MSTGEPQFQRREIVGREEEDGLPIGDAHTVLVDGQGRVYVVTSGAAPLAAKVQLTDFVDDGEVYPDGSIPIAPAKVEVASLDSLVGVAPFFDAVNLALNTDHRGSGTQSVEWDKAGTNIASGVQITLPAALDLSVYSTHAQVMWYGLIPDPAPDNVTQIYVALGTDNANYFYWAIPVADVHLGVFWHYHHLMSEVDGVFGVGADLSSVTWAAIVVVTDAVASVFADARIDQIVVKRGTEVVIHVCDGESIPTDVIDRAARLLGIIYGDAAQLHQVTPADALAPGDALSVAGLNFVYNGATWDMVREGSVTGSILTEDTGAYTNPLLKGRIFDTAIALDTDFFGADLVPTNTPITTFRIYVTLDTSGILSVQRTSVGTVAEFLNSGTALVADSAYMFDILVHEDDTINIQTDTGAQILSCMVIEVPGVIS